MNDKRSDWERGLWNRIGPPIYYSSECMLAVKVTPVAGQEPVIARPCGDCNCQVIAPRRAILTGDGKLTGMDSLTMLILQLVAIVTGRTAK